MMRRYDWSPGNGSGHGFWMSGWAWLPMTVGLVLVLGTLLTVAVLFLRAQRRPAPTGPGAFRPSPEQLLAERFARGEIDQQEYRDRLAALTEAAAGSPRQS